MIDCNSILFQAFIWSIGGPLLLLIPNLLSAGNKPVDIGPIAKAINFAMAGPATWIMVLVTQIEIKLISKSGGE